MEQITQITVSWEELSSDGRGSQSESIRNWIIKWNLNCYILTDSIPTCPHFSPASRQLRSSLCKCFLTSLSRLQRDVWEFEVCGWLHSTEWLGWREHACSFLSVSLVRWCQPHVWGIQRLLIDCSLHMNTNKSRGPQLQHKHLLNVFCHNYTWIGNVHAVFLWNRTHLCFEGWDQLLENRDRIRETFWLKTSQQYLSFMMS